MIWLVSTALAAPCDLASLRGLWPERVVALGADMDCADAQLQVGDALVELGAPQQAQQVWLDALDRHGPQPHLVSRVLRSPTGPVELQDRVTGWPQASWPTNHASALHLAAGRAAVASQDVGVARDHLAQVGGDLTPQAVFLQGTLHAELGKLKSGVRAFRDVWETEQGTALGDLSLLHIARIYASIERFDQAAAYYGMVRPGAEIYPQAQLEMAWALVQEDETDAALGALLSAQAPWYAHAWTLREARYLEALILGSSCHVLDADARLGSLIPDLQADRAELDRLVAVPTDRLLVDTYGGGDPALGLPASTWRGLLRDDELRVLVDAWTHLASEPVWLPEAAQARAVWLQDRAGDTLHGALVDLSAQTERLLADAEHARAQLRSGDVTPPWLRAPADDLVIDFTHPPRFREEPFYGEYWVDEIGDYSVWLEGCD